MNENIGSGLKLPERSNRREGLRSFADKLMDISKQVGFKISARGWAYQLEGFGLVNKAQFDRVEKIINECRTKGYLPINFTADEEGRGFSGVEKQSADVDGNKLTPIEFMKEYLEATLECEDWYTPDWWDGEQYYIQMIVEKIDLKTLFQPVCEKYHIPIATTKGWSSMMQRAIYARRFKEAEERGLICVLLYCGDHDPDGLRISDFLRKNLEDLTNIIWSDGMEGYNPTYLIIKRFGLDYDYIQQNNLTWIENLITGSGGYLAKEVNGEIVQGKTANGKPHPNFFLPYVQEYLKKYGVRKVEANALVVRPREARFLCRDAIEAHIGVDAIKRFEKKHEAVCKELKDFRKRTGLDIAVEDALELIE